MELVTYDLPWKPVTLAPLGDIQWTGRRSAVAWDLLKRHVDLALERDAWFLGMGDYIDFLSPSNRKRLAAAELYETAQTIVDDKALELTHQLYDELLKPTTGRWLGMLEGHHFSQLQSGATTDQKLCELLNAKFLGSSAYIRLAFQTAGHTDRSGGVRYLIWAHHGHGGGAKAHAPLLKLENLLPYWQGDLFLVGHMTKVAVAPIDRVRPVYSKGNKARLAHTSTFLVGTGGWSKGYEEFSQQGQVPRGGYVEKKMMNPVALGAPFIRLAPHEAREPRGEARARHAARTHDSQVHVTVEV